MDYLEIPSAHICCLALGGWVGLPFCIRFPHRARSLLLSGTPGGLIPESIRRDREKCNELEHKYTGLHESFSHIPSASTLFDHLEDIELAPGFSSRHPEKALLWRMLCQTNPPLSLGYDYGKLMYDAAVNPVAARQIRVPTLMVASTQDISWSVPALSEIASMIGPDPGAEVIVVEGAGHSLPFELPDIFNQILGAFLSKVKNQ